MPPGVDLPTLTEDFSVLENIKFALSNVLLAQQECPIGLGGYNYTNYTEDDFSQIIGDYMSNPRFTWGVAGVAANNPSLIGVIYHYFTQNEHMLNITKFLTKRQTLNRWGDTPGVYKSALNQTDDSTDFFNVIGLWEANGQPYIDASLEMWNARENVYNGNTLFNPLDG